MLEGNYIIDSIENGIVKLLYSDDETIEEVVNKELFIHPIKQGDILKIKFVNEKLVSIVFESETEERRKQAKNLLEKLINKTNNL